MYEWILDQPLALGVAMLFVIVFLRAGGTYLLGRGAHRLAARGRAARLLRRPQVLKAMDTVNRWGAPVVALSFLTIGFQTAINAAAGITRMPLSRYLPALVVGGLAWAVIYATVGLAAIMLWLRLFLLSPWAAVAATLVIIGVILLLVHARRRTADDAAGRSHHPG